MEFRSARIIRAKTDLAPAGKLLRRKAGSALPKGNIGADERNYVEFTESVDFYGSPSGAPKRDDGPPNASFHGVPAIPTNSHSTNLRKARPWRGLAPRWR